MTNTSDKTANVNQAAGFLKGIRLCLLFSLVLPAIAVQAKTADYVAIGNFRAVDLGTWTGIGGLATSALVCVSSANDDSPNPPGSASTMPYRVKVNNGGAAGAFTVYLNGNTGAAANARINMSLLHADVIAGGSLEQLTEGVYDSHNHVGQFKNCRDGDNAQLRVEISASELSGKQSGSYSGNFTLTAIGGSSGAATASTSFSISFIVQATPEVQVSSLDNLALGSHGGAGSIYAEENFCVYSTSASGSYSLSVSSSNQDGSGNFFLSGAPGRIAYDLYFADQASGPGTTKVGTGSLSGFGNSLDPGCNGQDNATLSISITEQDLQQARSGSYSDSLVILVAPQ